MNRRADKSYPLAYLFLESASRFGDVLARGANTAELALRFPYRCLQSHKVPLGGKTALARFRNALPQRFELTRKVRFLLSDARERIGERLHLLFDLFVRHGRRTGEALDERLDARTDILKHSAHARDVVNALKLGNGRVELAREIPYVRHRNDSLYGDVVGLERAFGAAEFTREPLALAARGGKLA